MKLHYLPPYQRSVLHYKYANTAQIKKALTSFHWEQAFSYSSINKNYFLNETIINVLNNYIPYKERVFDEQDPPLMNVEIEKLITAKNEDFKKQF